MIIFWHKQYTICPSKQNFFGWFTYKGFLTATCWNNLPVRVETVAGETVHNFLWPVYLIRAPTAGYVYHILSYSYCYSIMLSRPFLFFTDITSTYFLSLLHGVSVAEIKWWTKQFVICNCSFVTPSNIAEHVGLRSSKGLLAVCRHDIISNLNWNIILFIKDNAFETLSVKWQLFYSCPKVLKSSKPRDHRFPYLCT